MTIKMACPGCRGFDWSSANRDNWETIIPEKPHVSNCNYCGGTGVVSLLKHYYQQGKHKEIKGLKRFIKVLEDFRRNKLQNQSL